MFRIPAFAILAAAASLAACASPMNDADFTVTPSQRFPIAVEPKVATLTLPAAGTLSAGDQEKLRSFAEAYRLDGHGQLTIAMPASGGGQATVGRVLSALDGAGIARSRVEVSPSAAGPQAVEMSFVTYVATPTACGTAFPENLAWNPRNTTSSNFGCATQSNIAAMVADPRDLVKPRPLGPADAQRRAVVLEKWREGQPTGAKRTDEEDGSVAKVE